MTTTFDGSALSLHADSTATAQMPATSTGARTLVNVRRGHVGIGGVILTLHADDGPDSGPWGHVRARARQAARTRHKCARFSSASFAGAPEFFNSLPRNSHLKS